jgi:polyhydroxyalkanoate synthesis regulator phasin
MVLLARWWRPSVAVMPQNDGLRRYLEAAVSFTQITRSRAEDLVRDLIQTGEVERTRAQEWVEELVTTNRERSEAFLSTIRKEVQRQLAELDLANLDELARRVAEILARGQAAARKAGRTRYSGAKRTPAKKTPAKKAPAKKTAAKKAPAKKAAVNKAAVNKAAVKKAPATKTAVQKTAAKKAPAKSAAKRRA